MLPHNQAGQLIPREPRRAPVDVVTPQLIEQFATDCGLRGTLRLVVCNEATGVTEKFNVDEPFAIVGRASNCQVRLNHPDVNYRHAYLQVIEGRVYCYDLDSEHGVRWESTGEGSYTVEVVEKASRGTDVILHLRPEEDDLLSGHRLREILRKYSDHIAIPILMKQERWDSDARKQVVTDEDEQVNRASALWARPKSEITEEQYHELYKHVAHDVDAPLAYTHVKVEGRQEFTVLLTVQAMNYLHSGGHRLFL